MQTIKLCKEGGNATFLLFNLEYWHSDFDDLDALIKVETDGTRLITSYATAVAEAALAQTLYDPEKVLESVEAFLNAGFGLFEADDGSPGWVEFPASTAMEKPLFVPLVIYPVNGRAATVGPGNHWVETRQEAIQYLVAELEDQEANSANLDIETVAALLQTHDRVRCGRIVCQIVSLNREFAWQGIQVIA